MIYSLVLITAQGIATMGHYDTEADCGKAAEQFRRQSTTAGCVRQQTAQERSQEAEQLLQNFMRLMPK